MEDNSNLLDSKINNSERDLFAIKFLKDKAINKYQN